MTTTTRNETLDRRLGVTYREAMEAAHRPARVEIHVGPGVWEYLWSLATELVGQSFTGWPPRLFGFDVFFEPAWEPDRIEVQTKTAIH